MTTSLALAPIPVRELPARLAELRAELLAAGIRPVRPDEASPEPVGADHAPGDLEGDGR